MGIRDLALKIVIGAKDDSKGAINSVRGGVDSLGQSVERLKSQVLALAGSYVGLSGLKSALTGILEVGGTFEKLSVQMNAVMGSVKAGEKATQWVKDFAKNTPFELEGVSAAFVKLKAFGLDPMNGSMQAIADQTSKLGGGQQELEGIVLALGQAWTKQKLQGEEINQLVERGVPVWELLAKATGKNSTELANMAEKGRLGRREITLLIDAMGKSSAGASEAMMQTWGGQISNLKDTWSQFLSSVANSGVLDYMKTKLGEFLAYVGQLASNGQLQVIAQTVSDFFVGIGQGFEAAVGFVQKLWPSLQSMYAQVKPIIGQIVETFGKLAQPFLDLLSTITGRGITDVKSFGDAFGAALQGLIALVNPMVSAFNTGLNSIAVAFYGTAGTISTVLGGIFQYYAESARYLGLPFEEAEKLAQAFGKSADANFKKASEALASTTDSAAQTRDAFGALGAGGAATAKTVASVSKAAADTSKAVGDLAKNVDKLPSEPKSIYIKADTHEYTDKISEVKKPTNSTHIIEAANSIQQVKNAKGELEAPTHSTHYIRIVEVRDAGASGPTTAAVGQATGGLAGHPTGKIWRFATGGWARLAGKLPGFGGGDRRKALLEDGEYIVRKEAVAKLGVDVLDAVNDGQLPLQKSGGGGVNLDEEWRKKGIDAIKKLLKDSESQAVNRLYGWHFQGDPDYSSGMKSLAEGNGAMAKKMTADWVQREAAKIADAYGLGPDILEQVRTVTEALPVPESLKGFGMAGFSAFGNKSTINDGIRQRADRGFSDFEALSGALGSSNMPAMPSMSMPSMPTSIASTQSGGMVTVRFESPGGHTVTGQFRNGDVQALLDTLKSAGARTI